MVAARVSAQGGLSDMPSVERVKAEIKGSDATDTLARQVAVFTYLQSYIERIKINRTYRGPYTADEQRLIGAYSLAAYQMSQDYAKTHTPDEAKAFERLHGQYEDWSHRLIGPQSAAAYKNMETESGARQQKHYDQEMTDYKRDHAAQQAADKQIFGNKSGLSDDPTAVATRRCLELGGSSLGCVGKGMGAGFMDMIGFGGDTLGGLTGPGSAGVVLSGVYRNPATTGSLSFQESGVSIDGCGKLVSDSHGYAIEKRPGGAVVVTVANEPRPIVLTMRPDAGGLSGPGPVDVKGNIIIGYHTVTHTMYVNGAPAAGQGYYCNGPCSTSESVPDYAPKIERCTIGQLALPPGSLTPKPAPAAAAPAEDSGLLGIFTGLADTLSPGGAPQPGLRMTGKFSSGMLLLDFTLGTVTLDCGQAHVRQPYRVENTPDRLLVHVENAGGPFTLAVAPDNTLHGNGSTTVQGKLVTGMNGDNVAFAPHAESCEVGALRPKTGSMATTQVAANGAEARAAAAGAAAAAAATVESGASVTPAAASAAYARSTSSVSPAPAAALTSTPPAAAASVRAAMRVLITAAMPGAANPMVGQIVYVMRERMDEVLRKMGAPLKAGVTPGQAWQAFATECNKGGVDCAPIFQQLKSHFMTTTKLDAAGKATITTASAATGQYYLFSQVRTAGGLMVWDVPANFVAGDNTVTLTAANAEKLP
jgi:hypothetical protein